MRTLTLAAVALFASGCSLLLVEGPPNLAFRMPDDPIYCTESSILPAIDAVAAASNVAGAVIVGADNSGTFTQDEKNIVIGSGIVWAAIQTYSWHEGRKRIRKCREAKLEWMRARQPEQRPMPPVESDAGPPAVRIQQPMVRAESLTMAFRIEAMFEDGDPCAWTDTYVINTPNGWHFGRDSTETTPAVAVTRALEPLAPTSRLPWRVASTMELAKRYSHLYRAETGENRFLIADLLGWLGVCGSMERPSMKKSSRPFDVKATNPRFRGATMSDAQAESQR